MPNPLNSRNAALEVADRDRAAIVPLTATVAVERVLVVLRRSGV
ncbi:hypothetical protein OHB26_36830 [Nocardia sp. NBC_01503]|nr:MULTISPECIES: hypothetical protein [Nocardia]WTL32367.1 hypothetical protein OHB26_36830 [Nocardia sp. NBC_01503]